MLYMAVVMKTGYLQRRHTHFKGLLVQALKVLLVQPLKVLLSLKVLLWRRCVMKTDLSTAKRAIGHTQYYTH